MYFSSQDMQWFPDEEEEGEFPKVVGKCLQCGKEIFNFEKVFFIEVVDDFDGAGPFCSKQCAELYCDSRHVDYEYIGWCQGGDY